MDMKLELVVIPFSDLDRAKMFYADQLGFNLDHEGEGQRRASRHPADPARVGLLDCPPDASPFRHRGHAATAALAAGHPRRPRGACSAC